MRSIKRILIFTVICLLAASTVAQTYKYENINGFSQATNKRLKAFMEDSRKVTTHKVAVFDCDGTVLGQSPHYMCDEALIDYITETYGHRSDSLALRKMNQLERAMVNSDDELAYADEMVSLFAGLTVEQIEQIGLRCFKEKFNNQIFPEMRALINNLKNFGFDVYIVTASPELLYEGMCSRELGITTDHVIGVRAAIDSYGYTTSAMVRPVTVQRGKAEAIRTFIKTVPMFAAGNSRGDFEMMSLCNGLRMIINPDDTKPLPVCGGKTLRQYWLDDPSCIVETCTEVGLPGVKWSSDRYNLPLKPEHRK
ncbi:MAG: HAD family hydrolase [Muribaculaceae bacterium]